MTEENISIKITDEVANSVGTKIDGIAKSARNAFSELEKLQNSIRQIGLNDPVSRLVNDMTKLDQTILRVNRSQQLQEAAAAKTALSQQRLATEVQRTQVEMAKAEGALQKAVLAENQASAAALKLQAAQQKAGQEAARLAAEQQKAATAAKALADAEDGASARIRAMVAASLEGANAQDRLAAATIRANAAAQSQGNAWQANAAAQTAAMRGYDKTGEAALAAAKEQSRLSHALELVNLQNQLYEKSAKNTSSVQDALSKSTEKVSKASVATGNAVGKMGENSELARHHLVNLGFQLQDIFVSLASGQKPLTVAIQQGSQIGGIASQAGVGLGTMAAAAAKMVARFIPLVAVLGGVVGVFATLKAGMSTGEKQFEGYAKGLGATSKEIKKLGDLTVTYTDMAKGLYQTIKDSAPSNAVTSWFADLPERAGKAWTAMLKDALTFSVNLYGVIVGSKNTILAAWDNFPALFKAIIIGAYNDTGEALVQFINNTIKEINGLINALNSVKGYIPGLKELADVPTVAEAVFNKIEIKGDETSRSVLNSFSANIKAATESGQKSVAAFYKSWTKNSQDSAKERIKKKYDDLYGDAKAEKQSDALRKINAELDSQLDNLFKLSDQRTIDQKFDQIQIQLSSQKIKLSKDEAATIKDKITAIQEAQIVQKAYDAIYEESAGAQKTFNAYIDAAKILFDQGAISAEQYEVAVRKANETYANATDPLHSFNNEIQDQLKILKAVGPQQEAIRQRLQIENSLRTQGKKLTEEQTRSIEQQVESLRRATLVNDALNEIYGESNEAMDKLVAKYEALDIAMNRGIITGDQYNRRMAETAVQISQLKVDSDTGSWVDVMTAAIGKIPGAFSSMKQQVGEVMGNLYQDLDSGFQDAWSNIDKGFKGFADTLVDSFKKMIGELLHILITRPLLLNLAATVSGNPQIASMLGGGGGVGGGSGGGFDIISLGRNAYSAYSSLTGVGSAIYGGYQTGGVMGAIQGGAGYYGNMISNGANYVSGLFGGASAASGASAAAASSAAGASAAGYTGNAYATWTATQYASQAASNIAGTVASYAPYLAAIAGALQGWQRAGFKGAAAGAAGAVGGMYAGAAIGTAIFPGIGTAIGGAIGAMAGAIFGSKLFGGKWETKDAGITLGVEGGQLDAMAYEFQKKKGGMFSKNKKRTVMSELDPETAAPLQLAFDVGMAQIQGLFTSFGIELTQSAIDSLSVGVQQFSTKGKSDEELQTEIAKFFTDAFDSMTDQLNKATGNQFRDGLNLETLTNLLNNLVLVNQALESINVTLLKVTPSGAYAADALQQFAGGMEQFTANINGYYNAFYSETEKADRALASVRKQFEIMNVTLPDTREGYRKLVESMDVSYDAGQKVFTYLTSNYESVDAYYKILEQRQKEATDAATKAQEELAKAQEEAAKAASDAAEALRQETIAKADALRQATVSDAQRAFGYIQQAIQSEQAALTESYNAQVQTINDRIKGINDTVSELNGLLNSIDGAVNKILSNNDKASKLLYDQARVTVASAISTMKAGGKPSDVAGLSDAISVVGSNDSGRYSSWAQFAIDQAEAANQLEELKGSAENQLTVQDKILASLNQQLTNAKTEYDKQSAALQSQLDVAQKQLDTLNGINGGVISLKDALSQFATAIGAAYQSEKGANSVGSQANLDTQISRVYAEQLGRNVDAGGLSFWRDKVTSGAVSIDDVQKAIIQGAKDYIKVYGLDYYRAQYGNAAADAISKLPAYANGGQYNGGMALVGEYGPELINFQRGGEVMNARTSAGMLSSADLGELVDEVRELHVTVETLASQIAINTANTAFNTKDQYDLTREQNEVGIKVRDNA